MSRKSQLNRQTSWRDSFAAFTEQELYNIRHVILPSIPSFNGDSIAATEMTLLWEKMKWPRTEEVQKLYLDFCNRYYDGRFPIEFAISILSKFHDLPEWLRECVTVADLDKDGFVAKEEFGFLLEMLGEHDPSWKLTGKTYEHFKAEADINMDGKVSIDECVNGAVQYMDP